jgi:hypothetical protein
LALFWSSRRVSYFPTVWRHQAGNR